MQTLRIVPDLRSSVVEEAPASQVLLFTSQRGDADPALLDLPAVRPFTWTNLVGALRDPDLELVEVAEPLWLGEWVRALRVVALVKLLRVLRPRRRVRIATYAIENLDVRERLAFPSLDARPALGAAATRLATVVLGISLLSLDAVVFGTTGAYENYRRAFDWSLRRTRHTVLTPRLDACRVCGPGVAGGAARDRTVLFLGSPSERKGFGVLTDAWERSGAADRGWRLVVADPGGGDGRALPTGVSITSPSRSAVHELLRTAAVVAMPSVRRPGWREQIGLPLVEGLTHGCRVVTTTETGLADDLREHPLVVLTTPGDPQSLADGLRRAMADAAAAGTGPAPAGRAGSTKRDVVDWWLGAPTPPMG
ncbi:MAG TPA: glycosyltransferase family 4 protein [Actinomycetospora sp.]|nr:glycosyltransferase family 4 protein [Actinomycetospora sp.]